MRTLSADVVVIGSGMGGATAALALARRGADVLILERGDRLPREPANWSSRAVFIERRYRPAERWLDGAGTSFAPGVHYVVGGNTKLYGASLPRLRERDFAALEHRDGTSPAWPFDYAALEPYYAQAETIYRVHGTAGEDPTEPWRSTSFPYPALEHEPYVADLARRLRAQGVTASANAMGVDRRPGGACVRCATCDGFPCPLGAKSDAETCAVDPALRDRPCAPGDRHPGAEDRHRRRGSRRHPPHRRGARRAGARQGWPLRPVSGRGELGGTPARLRRREAPAAWPTPQTRWGATS